MCDPVSAIVGSAVIGAVASSSAADSAASSQDKAVKAQTTAAANELEFQQQQYNDWQAVYGPIQDNLSNFYQNLTPETLIASGLKNFEQQYQASQQQIERSFAQRGISSPAQDMMQQQSELGAAEARAEIRTLAPMQVATAQQGFLNQNVNNPAAAGVANAYGNQANIASQQANIYGQQAAQGYSALASNVQGGFNAYAQYQQSQALQQQALFNNVATNPGASAYSPTTGMPVTATNGWEML